MKFLSVLLLALASVLSVARADEPRPTLLISYESTPFELLGLDGKGLDYAARASLTAEALDETVPAIVAAMGVGADRVSTMVMPGGYQLATNASLQSSFDGSVEDARRFAAALGYTFRQWSVLVTDLTPAGNGNAAYAVVKFPHAVSGDEAAAFFQHAASVNAGLGGGYTAFDDEMFFINLGDSTGAPYSGLPDDQFVAELTRAAESFAGEARLEASGRVDAEFVENDWEAAPAGEGYATALTPAQVTALDPLRAANDAAMRAAVAPN